MAGNANDNLDWYLGTEETALSPLLIPELNQGFLGSCDGLDQYAKLFGLVYRTLENKTVGQGDQQVNYIYCNFMEIHNSVLQQFADIGVRGMGTVYRHPLSLLKFLLALQNTDVSCTRGTLGQIVPLMTSADVNQVLVAVYRTATDERADVNAHTVTCFNRHVTRLIKLLRYQGNRVRRTLQIITTSKQTHAQLTISDSSYQDLLMSMSTRTEVFNNVQTATAFKRSLIDYITKLINLLDNNLEGDLRLICNQRIKKTAISIPWMTARMEEAANAVSLWNVTWVINQNIVVEQIDDVKEITDRLNPLVTGIRGFTATSYDQASARKANLLPLCREISDKIKLFEDEPLRRNSAACKQLCEDITAIRASINNIRLEGVPINPDDLGGTDIASLEAAYCKVSGYVADAAAEESARIQQQKLQAAEIMKSAPSIKLKPLRSAADWLSFSKSCDEIFPLHSSNIIKQELLRGAIQAPDDKQLVKDLSFKQTIEFLQQKYSSESAVPRLINSLFDMKPCHTEKQSYDNLTKLISVKQQLDSHKAIAKLDGYTRQRLLPLLLTSSSLLDYTKDRVIVEAKWKSELEQEGELDDDLMSVHAKDTQGDQILEEKKRDYFLTQMQLYLNITRTLIQITPSKSKEGTGGGASRNKSHSNTARPDSGGDDCPLCQEVHYNRKGEIKNSFFYCPKFREMSIPERIRACSRNYFCKRCLFYKDEENHPNGACLYSDKTNSKCRECDPSLGIALTHHTLLHLPRNNGDSRPQQSRGGGRGGGRGGRGGGSSRRGQRGGKGNGRNTARKTDTTSAPHTSSGAEGGEGDQDQEESEDHEEECDQEEPPDGDGDGDEESSREVISSHDSTMSQHSAITGCALISPILSFSSKFTQMKTLDLKQNRCFLSCACIVKVTPAVQATNKSYQGVCILDSGSGLGWITRKFAQEIKAEPNKHQWKGSILTTLGKKDQIMDTYTLKFHDNFGKVHPVQLLCTTGSIGRRPSLPIKIHNELCDQFNIKASEVANIKQGDINIILGLDSVHLLAEKISRYDHPPKDEKYSGVRLYQSILSKKYFFCGAIGSDLVKNPRTNTLTFYSQPNDDPNSQITSFFSVQSGNGICHQNNSVSALLSACGSLLSRGTRKYIAHNIIMNDKSIHYLPQLNCCKNLSSPALSAVQTAKPSQLFSFLAYQNKKYMEESLLSESLPEVCTIRCRDCVQKSSNCRTCRYLNSSISLEERKTLEIFRKSIWVESNPSEPGKYIVYARFIFKCQPEKYFNPATSTWRASQKAAFKLREKLIKENLLESFFEEFKKGIKLNEYMKWDFNPQQSIQHFIRINYARKDSSVSTKLRIISNSASKNKSGVSLNDMVLCGPSNLNSPLKLVLQWRMFPVGFTADISRFYRSIFTTKICQQVRLFYFFEEPTDEQPQCFTIVRLNFGDINSSLVTEISVREVVCQNFHHNLTALIAAEYRFCDDFLYSFLNTEQADKIAADMIKTFDKFGFQLKMTIRTGQTAEITNVMGMSWHPVSDEYTVNLSLYPDEKIRGAQLGDILTPENIENTPRTRQLLARFVGQTFEYLNILLGPALTHLKICFSKLTEALPTGDWNTCCSTVDENLDQEIISVFKSLLNFNKIIKPIPRAILTNESQSVAKICLVSDAGMYSLGTCCYFIIDENNDLKYQSKLILSRSKIHKEKIPFAEFSALLLSAKLLVEILENISYLQSLRKLQVILATDSTIAINFLNPNRIFRNVRIRNVSFSIHKILEHFVDGEQDRTATIVHIPGIENPADKISKIIDFPGGPAGLANTDLWRQGPCQFRDNNWPSQEETCLKFEKNKSTFFQSPSCQQQNKDFERDLEKITASSSQRPLPANNQALIRCHASLELQQKDMMTASYPIICTFQPGYFNLQIYRQLVTRFSSLQKLVNTVKIILSFTTSMLDMKSPSHQDRLAFLVLTRSSQIHFPPEGKLKGWYPREGEDKILRATTRTDDYNSLAAVVLRSPVLISHKDTALTTLLIRKAHQRGLGAPTQTKVHNSILTTGSEIVTGRFAAIITNQTRVVTAYCDKCVVCRYLYKQPANPALQASRVVKYLHQSNPVFACVSLDPVGFYTRRCGRHAIKFWLIYVSCLVTGAVNILYTESLTSSSICQAVQNHCLDYRYPETIYVDKGSSVNIKRDINQFKEYFCRDIEVVQVERGHQMLNFVETAVRLSKKIIASVFKNRSLKSLPNLTMQEVLSLISAVRDISNTKPIHGKSTNITPNHFLKNNWVIGAQNQSAIIAGDLQTAFNQLAINTGLAQNNLINVLRKSWLSTPRNHKLGAEKDEHKFKEEDVILYLVDNEAKLGRVTKCHGNYCTIIIHDRGYQTKFKNIHTKMLIKLLRPDDFLFNVEKSKHTNRQTADTSPDTDFERKMKVDSNEEIPTSLSYSSVIVGQLVVTLHSTHPVRD